MTPIVVLRLRNMTAIDATGMKAIQDFADALHPSGRALLLCGASNPRSHAPPNCVGQSPEGLVPPKPTLSSGE